MSIGLLLAVIGAVALVIIVECVMILKRDNDKKKSCEKRQNVCLLKKEKTLISEGEKSHGPKAECAKVIYLKDRRKEYDKRTSKNGKKPSKSMRMGEVRKVNHPTNEWWI